MKTAVFFGVLFLVACTGSHSELRVRDCPGGYQIVTLRTTQVWTIVQNGDTFPNADAKVWHSGKPPNC